MTWQRAPKDNATILLLGGSSLDCKVESQGARSRGRDGRASERPGWCGAEGLQRAAQLGSVEGKCP